MFKIKRIVEKSLILALFLSILYSGATYCETKDASFGEYYKNNFFVPAGQTCSALLTQELNAKSSVTGQSINLILTEDFKYNDSLIAPEGSEIKGIITKVNAPGLARQHAKLAAKFTTIETPYGNIIPINAVFATKDNEGILKGDSINETIKGYTVDVTAGAASGAISGVISAAILDKDMGDSTIINTAVGAGLGIIKTISEKGENILIPPNSQIKIYFNQPITMNAL